MLSEEHSSGVICFWTIGLSNTWLTPIESNHIRLTPYFPSKVPLSERKKSTRKGAISSKKGARGKK